MNEIMNSYPVNKTNKVKIVSYNTDFVSEFPIPLPPIGKNIDSVMIKKIIAERKFPIKLENILGNENLEGIGQSKTLNLKEIFELSKLLYNTCGKFSDDSREVSKCFFPRNAILFYDENDKVFEILEICFECHRMQFYSKKSLEINGMCDNFYLKLENFYNSRELETKHKGYNNETK
ncbi:hypothetical protein CHRY9390_00142 [Chryseobacterium aquaeductus]|uniref:Uncharacterized protein n=2 Tax=Chryseobacterium aquaeductus TaxID=2675056 RepID=A0A9N8QR10_9FLAO|nr:hypothetical protein CHRY9390_00142 [Chryseobacterium potabilaquae]CAD7797284.1 hypothetical protein CHRY9390_00142 [Chryseobacterium aquaeductus]